MATQRNVTDVTQIFKTYWTCIRINTFFRNKIQWYITSEMIHISNPMYQNEHNITYLFRCFFYHFKYPRKNCKNYGYSLYVQTHRYVCWCLNWYIYVHVYVPFLAVSVCYLCKITLRINKWKPDVYVHYITIKIRWCINVNYQSR